MMTASKAETCCSKLQLTKADRYGTAHVTEDVLCNIGYENAVRYCVIHVSLYNGTASAESSSNIQYV